MWQPGANLCTRRAWKKAVGAAVARPPCASEGPASREVGTQPEQSRFDVPVRIVAIRWIESTRIVAAEWRHDGGWEIGTGLFYVAGVYQIGDV